MPFLYGLYFCVLLFLFLFLLFGFVSILAYNQTLLRLPPPRPPPPPPTPSELWFAPPFAREEAAKPTKKNPAILGLVHKLILKMSSLGLLEALFLGFTKLAMHHT